MVHFEKNGKTGFCLSLLAMACSDPKVTLTHALNIHIAVKLLQNVETRIL